ncbi:MAG: hypothetical protein ACFFB0_18300 [Promethearchaeota archaeon]
MQSIREILTEVLKKITPSSREISLIENITNKLKKLLNSKAKELNIKKFHIEPQGSTGIKQTQLKDDFDIDLFIGLDYKEYEVKYRDLSKNQLKKESKKDFLWLCKNWIIQSLTSDKFHNPRLLYAEHPYVTVDYLVDDIQIKIDIVLYFSLSLERVKEHGPITAVDRSPWHGRFVKENLTEEQKNDVRILKQFFKANHCYGDKSAVGKVGFIGYSSELLIYYFDDIVNLFTNFNDLKDKPLDCYSRTREELNKITHFQNDYLIIVDPIDKNRNVASAISERAYKYCNHRISEFLRVPNIKFFEINPIPEIDLSNLTDPLLTKIFILELKNEDQEIHYTINRDKLYSLGESIKANAENEFSHAERFGKILYEVYFEDDVNEYNLAFYCEKPIISESYIRRGPPISEQFHASKFRKKNPKYFEKEGYLWIESKRSYTEFLDFLQNFVKNKIPKNLKVLNIASSFNSQSRLARKTLYILINMVLPFYL